MTTTFSLGSESVFGPMTETALRRMSCSEVRSHCVYTFMQSYMYLHSNVPTYLEVRCIQTVHMVREFASLQHRILRRSKLPKSCASPWELAADHPSGRFCTALAQSREDERFGTRGRPRSGDFCGKATCCYVVSPKTWAASAFP